MGQYERFKTNDSFLWIEFDCVKFKRIKINNIQTLERYSEDKPLFCSIKKMHNLRISV